MATCGKRIMRKQYLRNDKGEMTGETKLVDAAGFSEHCTLNIDDGPHEGPCTSPADQVSVRERIAWQAKHDEEIADKRHADSGLGFFQSRPKPVSAIIDPGSLHPHPSAPTDCPFCKERPMHKDLMEHVRMHVNEIPTEIVAPEPKFIIDEPAVVDLPKLVEVETIREAYEAVEVEAQSPGVAMSDHFTKYFAAARVLATWSERFGEMFPLPPEIENAIKVVRG
jgi:hypothetical protein